MTIDGVASYIRAFPERAKVRLHMDDVCELQAYFHQAQDPLARAAILNVATESRNEAERIQRALRAKGLPAEPLRDWEVHWFVVMATLVVVGLLATVS